MGIPKNSINTPLELTREEILKKLDNIVTENTRLKANSTEIKLALIKEREKLNEIINIINK